MATPGRVETFALLYVIGSLLLVGTVLALAHLVREQHPWLAQVGGVLAVGGIVLETLNTGAFMAVLETGKLDATIAVGTLDKLESNPVLVAGFVGSVAITAGVIVLGVGLLRARTAPAWIGALLIVGMVLDLVGNAAISDVAATAGIVAIFVALAPLGYRVMTEPDEAWAQPTPLPDLRPAAGTR